MPPMLEAYPDRHSLLPGETIGLCCSADLAYTVEIARSGGEREVRWRSDRLGPGVQAVPDDAAQAGGGWPVTVSVPVGADWRSGFYEVTLSRADGLGPSSHAGFVVRALPADRAPYLLVLSTATWAAYNDWGGPSLYEGASVVSMQRPWGRGFIDRPDERGGRHANVGSDVDVDFTAYREYVARHGLSNRCGESGWASRERRFVRWAERAGYRIDVANSGDLHEDPDLLAGHRCVLSVGHDEYWSWEMRDHVEAFVADGGNAAFLTGNTAFWQVRYDDDLSVMTCHKFTAPWNDPLVGTPDERRITGMWSDPLIGRPEAAMTGLSFTRGGYVRFGFAVPRGSGGYTVWRHRHWAFEGTDLRYGDLLGAASVIVGYEADGCELRWVDGLPEATGADDAPPQMEVLATSPAHLWSSTAEGSELPPVLGHPAGLPSDLEYAALRLFGDMEPHHTSRLAQGNAVMATFAVAGGGEVFNTGCTEWVYGLDDPAVARITANVLDRFGQPQEHGS